MVLHPKILSFPDFPTSRISIYYVLRTTYVRTYYYYYYY